jgi:large subunit ribosomal protein L29
MKAVDLREKTREDLLELQKVLARDVFRNRLKNFTNRLDDTSAVRKTRRDLARVLTLLRQGQATVGSPIPATGATPSPEPKVEVLEVAKKETKAQKVEAQAPAAPAPKKVKKVKASSEPAAKASLEPAAPDEGARPKKSAAKKSEAKER